MRLADRARWPLALVGAVLVPILVTGAMPTNWVNVATSAAIAALVATSLGVVTQRAGMLVLCAMSFAAVGAWTVSWMNVHDFPGGFFVWCLLGGLVAVPVGIVIAFPALRLRGVNLAVITLGFAVMLDQILSSKGFPGANDLVSVERPESVYSVSDYFLFCWGVLVVVLVGLALLDRTRIGSAWRAVAFSERSAAAAGLSVVRAKVSAFAVTAFVAGLAGGLVAGQTGTVVAQNFSPAQSLVILALAVVAGSRYPEGAVFAGVLSAFVPFFFQESGIAQSWSSVLFAVATIASLGVGVSAAEGWRAGLGRLLRSRRATGRPRAPETDPNEPPARVVPGGSGKLEIRGLTVRYGAVVAVEDVDLTVAPGEIVGLIGPNGAGKTTLLDATTGFVSSYEGTVALGGVPLDGTNPPARTRAGMRRTFQQNRAPLGLSVGKYISLAAGTSLPSGEIDDLLGLLGGPPAQPTIGELDLRDRRLAEIAAAVAARPQVLLLDEPAAGLTEVESRDFGSRIARLPELYGCGVLLVEHDIELVSSICSRVTVLDFGKQISTGVPAEVLATEVVVDAYLGREGAVV